MIIRYVYFRPIVADYTCYALLDFFMEIFARYSFSKMVEKIKYFIVDNNNIGNPWINCFSSNSRKPVARHV